MHRMHVYVCLLTDNMNWVKYIYMHVVHNVLFDAIWCTFWRQDIFPYVLTWWRTFLPIQYVLFDVMTYLLTFFHNFWRHDLFYGVMTHFTYFMTLWCTYLRYDVLFIHCDTMTYSLMLWHTFLTCMCHEILFDVMTYLHDILTYALT